MNLKKFAAAGTLAICAAASAGYALAATYYTDVVYFSDATYSVEVGETVKYCNNHYETWGTQTIYKRTVEQYNCAYPIP